jgi:hypothetical protein
MLQAKWLAGRLVRRSVAKKEASAKPGRRSGRDAKTIQNLFDNSGRNYVLSQFR